MFHAQYLYLVSHSKPLVKENASTSKDELKYWTNNLKYQMCSNILVCNLFIILQKHLTFM